jgi:hypothetical protein
MTIASVPEWDAFISHASEDKDRFVRPLAHALTALGATIWYDEFSLKLGDSLSASIDRGLANSRFGIVIVSPAFMSKPWPKRELQGLVACEIDGRSAILPVWHEVERKDVLAFSPPLADKLATNTANKTAKEIALQILSVIRPDIAGKTPHEELLRIASGEAVDELRNELERVKNRLQEFQCPHCGSNLIESQQVPLDAEEKDWDVLRSFECGFTELGGEIRRLCPSDPRFPSLDEYEIRCHEDPSQPAFFSWTCEAFPKTKMARLLQLPRSHGRSETAARRELEEQYEQRAHPQMRPMGVNPLDQ